MKENLPEILKAVEVHLLRMCDPNHPVYKLTIERDGYGVGADGKPEVVAFHLKLEHLSVVAHLPVRGATGLFTPSGAEIQASPQPVVEEPVVVSGLEQVPPTDPDQPQP